MNSMKPNSTITVESAPLHVVLRRRREELHLIQAQIAERLHVTPECVVLWECGRRRPELSKLPRLAEALQLDPKQLCERALAEFHPPVYETLFGNGLPTTTNEAT
jgi:transcriptional regulator with XRE-family HTH domain